MVTPFEVEDVLQMLEGHSPIVDLRLGVAHIVVVAQNVEKLQV